MSVPFLNAYLPMLEALGQFLGYSQDVERPVVVCRTPPPICGHNLAAFSCFLSWICSFANHAWKRFRAAIVAPLM